MKNLIIIGARGYGREVCWTATNCKGYKTDFQIAGFLDDKFDALDGLWGEYPPIISSVEDFEPKQDDIFICALGDPDYRKKYSDIILDKGGLFTNLIEREVDIHPSAKIGYGNIISKFCSISCDTVIGNFNVLHREVVIGHDVSIGDYNFIGTRSFIGGGANVGNFSTLNPSCAIHPRIVIEDHAIVGPNSTVIRRVKAHTSVLGVPAMKIKF